LIQLLSLILCAKAQILLHVQQYLA
jgi:hypothetical protein